VEYEPHAVKVSRFNEDALIARLTRNLPVAPDVRVGIGSDCAVIGQPRDKVWLVLKTDCVVESVHFLPGEKPERIGWKALCRAISDVAACGGVPRHALITLVVPCDYSVERLEGVYAGICKAARSFGVSVVGGETSRSTGGFFLNVALTGEVERKCCVSRTGGRAGDRLYVSGRLGGSMRGKHLDFTPRLDEARWLVTHYLPHAMMDISDGLAKDLPRLAAASKCGFVLNEEEIPKTRGCSLKDAMEDGEDFELLFAMSPKLASKLETAWKKKFPRVPLTCIGQFVRSSAPSTQLTYRGFDHFT